ncbi:MAG: NHL repeat-containing protein [Acidobacteriaceae bacterium]
MAPQIVVVAGGGSTIPSTTPESATSALIMAPSGVGVDTAGNIYVADENAWLVEKISVSTGQIAAVVDNPNVESEEVAVDGEGDVLIADASFRVDQLDPTGNLGVVAGGGNTTPSTTPIAATSANISVYGVATDNAGNLYIAGGTVEKVYASSGEIVLVAGGGGTVPNTNPIAATSAKIFALSVAADAQGNLYIADGNGLIEKLNLATGQITVVAGGGNAVPSTTPIPATSAKIKPLTLNGSSGIAVDANENIYIVDGNTNAIEEVDAAGQIVVVAGSGSTIPTTTPITAVSASIVPMSVAVDRTGNLYIGDLTHSTAPNGDGLIEKVIMH